MKSTRCYWCKDKDTKTLNQCTIEMTNLTVFFKCPECGDVIDYFYTHLADCIKIESDGAIKVVYNRPILRPR